MVALKRPVEEEEETVRREKRRLEYSDDEFIVGTAKELASSSLTE